MPQFVAFYPHTEIIGRAIWTAVLEMDEDILAVLDANGLDNLEPETWYPQQTWLNALKAMNQGHTQPFHYKLVVSGIRAARRIQYEPEVQTIPEAIRALSLIYATNHRNKPNYEGIFLEENGVRHLRVKFCTPYPHAFEYGVLQGTAHRFQPDDANLMVRFDINETPNDDTCIYHIVW